MWIYEQTLICLQKGTWKYALVGQWAISSTLSFLQNMRSNSEDCDYLENKRDCCLIINVQNICNLIGQWSCNISHIWRRHIFRAIWLAVSKNHCDFHYCASTPFWSLLLLESLLTSGVKFIPLVYLCIDDKHVIVQSLKKYGIFSPFLLKSLLTSGVKFSSRIFCALW